MTPPKIDLENAVHQVMYDPTAFDFFEAVRRIQKVARAAERKYSHEGPAPGAYWGQPLGSSRIQVGQAVTFRSHISNSFPAGSIQDVQLLQKKDRFGKSWKQLEMVVNFLGLTGPNGILPNHYTDLLIQFNRNNTSKEKNALRDWFDLFNNRLISIFYLAWEKYQLPVQREFAAISHKSDPIEKIFRSYGGLGTEHLSHRITSTDPLNPGQPSLVLSDLFLSTRLARSHRSISVSGLQNLISKSTGSRVQIQCFAGRWETIPPGDMVRLGSPNSSQAAQLGVNTTLGSRMWSAQSNFMVKIGPVSWPELNRFLPLPKCENKKSLPTLIHVTRQLAKLKSDSSLNTTIRIHTKADEILPARLGNAASGLDQPSKLGWNMWLGSPERHAGFDDLAGCKYRKDTEFNET